MKKYNLDMIIDVGKNILDEAAQQQAKKDIKIYFMTIFGKARQIAANEQSGNTELKIKRSIWNEAKWQIHSNWSGKKSILVWVLDFLLLLGPIAIGFGLSDPQDKWLVIIIGAFFMSIIFAIKVSKERK